MNRFICPAIFLAIRLTLGTGTAAPADKPAWKPDRIVAYKTVKTEKGTFPLQLHIFNPAGQDSGGKRPCVVLFHGGGWISGEPAEFHGSCRRWASRGFVAIAVEYRIRDKHGDTPLDSVRDAKSSIRWIRSHAGELGIDPGKIAAWGTSVGGHLVAATALLKKYDEQGEDTSVSCRPDAMLMVSPVFDNSPGGYGHYHKILKKHWRDFSPLHNIAAGAPPAIVFVGDSEEKYLTVAAAGEFQRKMKALGSRCELFILKGATHTKRSKEHGGLIDAEERKFLASLGYCEPGAAGNSLECNPATR
jgi:acetyl esterase/lipase